MPKARWLGNAGERDDCFLLHSAASAPSRHESVILARRLLLQERQNTLRALIGLGQHRG